MNELLLVVTIGGWSQLQGAQVVAFVYALIYLGMAFFVSRWNRGVLPVAAASCAGVASRSSLNGVVFRNSRSAARSARASAAISTAATGCVSRTQ